MSGTLQIPRYHFTAALYLDLLWQIFLSNHLLFMGCFFSPRWRCRGEVKACCFWYLFVSCWIHLPLKWSFMCNNLQWIQNGKTNYRWNVKVLFQVKVNWFSKCWTCVILANYNLRLFNVESYKPKIQASNVGSLWGATLLLFRHSIGFFFYIYMYSSAERPKSFDFILFLLPKDLI